MNNKTPITKREVSKRTITALVAMLLLFALLAGRLAYLQLFNYEGMRDKVLEQYSSTTTGSSMPPTQKIRLDLYQPKKSSS